MSPLALLLLLVPARAAPVDCAATPQTAAIDDALRRLFEYPGPVRVTTLGAVYERRTEYFDRIECLYLSEPLTRQSYAAIRGLPALLGFLASADALRVRQLADRLVERYDALASTTEWDPSGFDVRLEAAREAMARVRDEPAFVPPPFLLLTTDDDLEACTTTGPRGQAMVQVSWPSGSSGEVACRATRSARGVDLEVGYEPSPLPNCYLYCVATPATCALPSGTTGRVRLPGDRPRTLRRCEGS